MNFDQSTSTRYTVQAGDTLESIALQQWGDASFWYLIADSNGLSGSDTLAPGMDIILPNKVHNIHNDADTYRVYDPNKAMGNLSPTAPKPVKPSADNGCGAFGGIILAIVAIAVSIITLNPVVGFLIDTVGMGAVGAAIVGGAIAAAAGSIVSQGIGLATGIQKSFNWGAVGMAAIGGAVGGGLGAGGIFGKAGAFSGLGEVGGAVARGVAGSMITQGIGVATGLQKQFDWTGVAAAGVGAGISAEMGEELNANGVRFASDPIANSAANGFVSGMAGAIANAATRTLISGTDFGDNIIAALPDAIGNTVGNLIGEEVQAGSDESILEAHGVSPDVARGYAEAAVTGDNSFFIKTLTDAGQSNGGGWNLNGLNNAISLFNKTISFLPSGTAAQLTWTFDLARVSIGQYSGMQSIIPASFSLQNQGSLPSDVNFNMSLLSNSNDGYFSNLYYYNNTDNAQDPHNGTYVLADRGTRGLFQNTPESQLDSATDTENFYGKNSPAYDDAVNAAYQLSAALGTSPLVFVGHSLGGALAIDQAFATGRNAVVFDTADPSIGTLYDAEVSAGVPNVLSKGVQYGQLSSFEATHVQAWSTFGDPLTNFQILNAGDTESPAAAPLVYPHMLPGPMFGKTVGPDNHSAQALFDGLGNFANENLVDYIKSLQK